MYCNVLWFDSLVFYSLMVLVFTAGTKLKIKLRSFFQPEGFRAMYHIKIMHHGEGS